MTFDSDAFGFPFHRVVHFDEQGIQRELDLLTASRPVAVDAKCPAEDIATTQALMRLGFRKVCMQVTLQSPAKSAQQTDVEISNSLLLPDEILWRHASNFTADRFSLDPLLPSEGRHGLYFKWLRNSLNGSKQVASIGPNLCTFSYHESDAIIDLVSILEPRRGFGRRIMQAVQATAHQHGAASVIVTTECENRAAWSLYQACGFIPIRYTAAFHLVLTAG
jgi:hypothetical protein